MGRDVGPGLTSNRVTDAGRPFGLERFTRECVLPFIGEHRIPFDIRCIELAHGGVISRDILHGREPIASPYSFLNRVLHLGSEVRDSE